MVINETRPMYDRFCTEVIRRPDLLTDPRTARYPYVGRAGVGGRARAGGAPERPASSGVLSFLAVYLAVISWCTYRSLRSTATGMVDGDVAAADAKAANSHRTIGLSELALHQSPRTKPACS